MDDIWSLDVLPVAFNAVFYSSYSCCILTVRILGLVFTGSYYSNSNVASLSGPVVSVHFTLFYFFFILAILCRYEPVIRGQNVA